MDIFIYSFGDVPEKFQVNQRGRSIFIDVCNGMTRSFRAGKFFWVLTGIRIQFHRDSLSICSLLRVSTNKWPRRMHLIPVDVMVHLVTSIQLDRRRKEICLSFSWVLDDD